ncbi:unnamed protein product [Blepharisma stoltei]|uniref:YIP1 family protein n=1 Tax=Blepharisma stoltei TaxID=1481888 RepID=A0AAU9J0C8_9CILI|nr:unnamed protein product [Blepharisma stoltei]
MIVRSKIRKDIRLSRPPESYERLIEKLSSVYNVDEKNMWITYNDGSFEEEVGNEIDYNKLLSKKLNEVEVNAHIINRKKENKSKNTILWVITTIVLLILTYLFSDKISMDAIEKGAHFGYTSLIWIGEYLAILLTMIFDFILNFSIWAFYVISSSLSAFLGNFTVIFYWVPILVPGALLSKLAWFWIAACIRERIFPKIKAFYFLLMIYSFIPNTLGFIVSIILIVFFTVSLAVLLHEITQIGYNQEDLVYIKEVLVFQISALIRLFYYY